MTKKIKIYTLFILVLFSCSKSDIAPSAGDSTSEIDTIDNVSVVARNYLNQVINIMQDNSINKYTIDWNNLRTEAFTELENNAQTIQDTYPGILKALELLGDNHSFYIGSNEQYVNPNSVICEGTAFDNVEVPSHIGYVKVSNFNGSAGSDGIAFAENIRTQIQSQDGLNIEAWIVDLRANTGGNMWPMLTGIGPVLGNGTSGYFVDPDQNEIAFGFDNNSSFIDGTVVMSLEPAYELANPNPKVAVLLDNGVASSGEAIAVSFISRPNTRTFGDFTCGLSTANTPFTLSDNARLLLTTHYFADRDLNVFGEQLSPDQFSATEAALTEAINWINNN
ncbi:S41 family peptidase [Psychroserpens luteolus]|uniref:S41 family peptidase n=1 Tax=Psychroserpens luteolus TaxID=2855840 RepID=UPI001E355B33|nr:S41 family peptidase [Psychroserpens luteolus]MCD2259402.1 S41 family peptidase [Psychroserpens luteolus]